MMIDRRLVQEIDWILPRPRPGPNRSSASSSSTARPISCPAPSTSASSSGSRSRLLAMLLVLAVDYKYLRLDSPPYLYGLVVVLRARDRSSSPGSWPGPRAGSPSGLMQLQPSELAKIVMILVFARLFAEYKGAYPDDPHTRSAALLVAGSRSALIVLQPDLGTAMTFIAIIGGAFILAGLRQKAVVVFLAGRPRPRASAAGTSALKDYQKKRLTTLVNPGEDPRGSGYQVLQSKIAIGSGGLAGKGFSKGTQSQLRFLPARHTDFIFSVIGEETGFLGVSRRPRALFRPPRPDVPVRRQGPGPGRGLHHLHGLAAHRLPVPDQRPDDHRALPGRRDHPALPELRRLVAADDLHRRAASS